MRFSISKIVFLVLILSGINMSYISVHELHSGKFTIVKVSDARYELTYGDFKLLVDANTGGRIISCKLGNKELITGKDINPAGYGSTFWTSPQSIWNWPPPAALDNKPYKVLKAKHSLVLLSEKDPRLDWKFQKEFSFDTRDSSFVIDYSIINLRDTARPTAPWEVTRVLGDLSFFPIGKNEVLEKSNLKSTSVMDGILWYSYNPEVLGRGEKLFSGASAGWLAHVHNGMMFIKKFEHVQAKDTAPGESEVEIYATRGFPYIELENQGPYIRLQPNDTLHWQVKWYIRNLPPHIKPVAGNNELVKFVKEVIGGK